MSRYYSGEYFRFDLIREGCFEVFRGRGLLSVEGEEDFCSVMSIKRISDSLVNSSEISSEEDGLGRLLGLIICNSIHARPEEKEISLIGFQKWSFTWSRYTYLKVFIVYN